MHRKVRVYPVEPTTWERSLKRWELHIPDLDGLCWGGNTSGLVPSSLPQILGYAYTLYAPTLPIFGSCLLILLAHVPLGEPVGPLFQASRAPQRVQSLKTINLQKPLTTGCMRGQRAIFTPGFPSGSGGLGPPIALYPIASSSRIKFFTAILTPITV